MAIVIKNLSAPANCSACPFLEEKYDEFSGLYSAWCAANGFSIKDLDPCAIEEKCGWMNLRRHPNCPIVEVKWI